MYNKLIISLGSNSNGETNLGKAERLLRDAFPVVLFSESIYTEPLNLPASAPFLNQLVLAYSPLSALDVRALLKEMEIKIGRTPQSKSVGIIPIDIDLLQWNDQILKADDYNRTYIQALLSSLSSTSEEYKRCSVKTG